MKEIILENWKKGWVGRSNITSTFFNEETGDLETIYIGKRGSSITMRTYDKVAEATCNGTLEYWRDIWENHDRPVTRLEWQVAPKDGDFQLSIQNFDDFNDNTAKELLNYLVNWGRLCTPNPTETNKHRWKDDPLWGRVRSTAAEWAGEINWPISRLGKQYCNVTASYLKFFTGALSGGIARISPSSPDLYGLIEGLAKLGINIEDIIRVADEKARIIRTV